VTPKRYAAGRARALGLATRGTTAPNRLRRVDRWLVGVHGELLRSADRAPLVVDLGFGASPVTTVELAERLRAVRTDVRVVGLEIDVERVAVAKAAERDGLSFQRGGFELAGLRPVVVRALNVLRQYDEQAALDAWEVLRRGLAPGGLLVEGTCDEIGRRAVWVALTEHGPQSLTLAAHLPTLSRPSDLAERLPKALIHHNVPGQPVHALLAALDAAWDRSASYASFGARARWVATCEAVEWPVHPPEAGGTSRSRWRLGELTVDWQTVAPV
jgi:hypothetical protein